MTFKSINYQDSTNKIKIDYKIVKKRSKAIQIIKAKRHLQHNSLPFLPPASRFTKFWLGHAQKSKPLIWASWERSFPPAKVEYRCYQFSSKLMMSEVEERPRLATAGYCWHVSQWVKGKVLRGFCCFSSVLQSLL